jgi:phage tail-like protein
MARYPLPVFHFTVQWGGNNVGFSEVSGLTQEVQVIEYREGSSPDFGPAKMPGLHKVNNITLKRGMDKADNQFYTWLRTIELNKVERRDLTIMLLNEKHEPVATWKVQQAWPVKVEGPGLKSTGNEVAVESIELAHEGLSIENS